MKEFKLKEMWRSPNGTVSAVACSFRRINQLMELLAVYRSETSSEVLFSVNLLFCRGFPSRFLAG